MAAPMEEKLVANILFESSEDLIYTSCYCEENVWQLCKDVQEKRKDQLPDCYCIFISNAERTIPLWCQKASKQEDGLVVWDYHVIFLHKLDSKTQVYDLDSSLTFPCDFKMYAEKAIRSCANLKPKFHRRFRVVPAEEFLESFASDRSHMLDKDNKWLKAPPSYPCIQTEESTNNIQEFISMDPSVGVGKVVDFWQLCDKFYQPHKDRDR